MRQLRLLHIAICIGATIALIVFTVILTVTSAARASVPPVIPWTLLGVSVAAIVAGALIRGSIPPMEAAANEDEWAKANQGRSVAVWAACEGGVALAAVAIFFGANPFVAGSIAAGGLGFLASQSPGTLAGH